MHGILAFAARHLSTQIAPDEARHYLDQSTELQTWALAHFDPAPQKPDRETCVALFLFSSLIGTHALADISLLDLEPEPFFIRFGHYFSLHRGVKAISDDYWTLLEESDVQPVFQWLASVASSKGRGSECDSIQELVLQSTLSPAATEACNIAIEQLQCVLDECNSHRSVPVHCIYGM
jgi:hypothetical protein